MHLGRVSEAVMDGAYDNSKAYRLLRRMNVKPIIKPRRNARDDRGPPERRRMVRLIRRIGDEEWAGMVGYGRRWAVETTFSTLNASMENTAWRKTWSRERTRSQSIHIQHANKPIKQNQKRKHKSKKKPKQQRIKPQS